MKLTYFYHKTKKFKNYAFNTLRELQTQKYIFNYFFMKALNAVNFEKFSVSCRQIDLDANSGAKDEICTIDVIVINQVRYLLHEVVNN